MPSFVSDINFASFLIEMGLFVLFLIFGCNDDVLQLKQYGYLKVNGDITIPSITGKANVPECSPFEPNKIKYRLLNEVDQAFYAESSITIRIENEYSQPPPQPFHCNHIPYRPRRQRHLQPACSGHRHN